MAFEMKDVWDFHTDIRHFQMDIEEYPYLREQIDLDAVRQIGGVFSATSRKIGAPQAEQWKVVETQANIIKSMEGLPLVRTAAEVDGTGRQLLHAEGSYFIESERDFPLLDTMWEMGFRSLALTHDHDNALAGGARGDPDRGLQPLGRDYALEAWRKGFLFDAAHLNHKSKRDILELAGRNGQPIHYSHGMLDDPYAAHFQERNVPREIARDLLATGGLIGLSPHPGFLGSYERYLEEIAFLAGVAPEQVVFGTDFAGIHTPGPGGERQFAELQGVWAAPAFADRLAGIHGEAFARSFLSGALKEMLKRSLPA